MRQKALSLFLVTSAAILISGLATAANDPLLPELPKSQLLIANTIPPNGDVNPYGVTFVPASFPSGGSTAGGDILVSNFNDSANLQGTGTTIVSITPQGNTSVFFQGPAGLGLTTALGVLDRGVVLVGNVPTTDGSCATVKSGSLLVLNKRGQQIGTLANSSLLNGPWDLLVHNTDAGSQVFVSNVLSGTVTRLDLAVAPDGNKITLLSATQIASGYGHRCDPNALVVGPTGLAYDDHRRLLYVAATADNAIYAIKDADDTPSDRGKGTLTYTDHAHLRGPVGLVLVPNGDLIATNGDAVNGNPNQPSEMVEFTPSGHFVAQLSVDTGGQGGAFGLAISGSDDALKFVAVDDVNNTLKVWTVR